MTTQYRIAWRNKIHGKTGAGTKLLSKSEADRLVEELNEEYPHIEHEAVDASTVPPKVERVEQEPPPSFKPLTDDDLMPFGPKYIGVPMRDVPASYLDWLSGQGWLKSWPAIADYIERNREDIDADLDY